MPSKEMPDVIVEVDLARCPSDGEPDVEWVGPRPGMAPVVNRHQRGFHFSPPSRHHRDGRTVSWVAVEVNGVLGARGYRVPIAPEGVCVPRRSVAVRFALIEYDAVCGAMHQHHPDRKSWAPGHMVPFHRKREGSPDGCNGGDAVRQFGRQPLAEEATSRQPDRVDAAPVHAVLLLDLVKDGIGEADIVGAPSVRGAEADVPVLIDALRIDRDESSCLGSRIHSGVQHLLGRGHAAAVEIEDDRKGAVGTRVVRRRHVDDVATCGAVVDNRLRLRGRRVRRSNECDGGEGYR
jgi:hypothetical protein